MISKFVNFEVSEHDENDMDIIIDVELQNQPKDLIDPSIVLTFQNGEHVNTEYLQQGYLSEDYTPDEIELLQALVYVSKQDEIKEMIK